MKQYLAALFGGNRREIAALRKQVDELLEVNRDHLFKMIAQTAQISELERRLSIVEAKVKS